MKVDVDLRTIDLQLNNGLVTAPAEVRLDFDGIDVVVYVPAEDGENIMVHQISLTLAGSQVRLIIRSPLGSKPEVRTLYDFAKGVST